MKLISAILIRTKLRLLLRAFLIISLTLISSQIQLKSQGFDWQSGARFPYEIPTFYIGVNTAFDINNHYGNFNFKEDFIVCCKFTNGSGSGYRFGLVSEYWYDALTAVSATLDYSETNADFKIRSVLPTRTGDFITDYMYSSSIKNINLELLARRRISLSHFSYGAGLRLSVLLNENNEYSEQAITNNVPFEKRVIASGTKNDLNLITISPMLFVAYDVPLGVGYYASPNFALNYNLNSIIEDESWRKLSFSLGVRIFRNL